MPNANGKIYYFLQEMKFFVHLANSILNRFTIDATLYFQYFSLKSAIINPVNVKPDHLVIMSFSCMALNPQRFFEIKKTNMSMARS